MPDGLQLGARAILFCGVTMVDHSRMKLGRRSIRYDSRQLMLARYTQALEPPPVAVDWMKGITEWGMMLNGPDPANPPRLAEGLGCCTISACAHAVQVWTANLGRMVTIPDAGILAAYEVVDGYDPANPSTDQGGVELDVLKAWRKFGFAGHRLAAFADPPRANLKEIRQAINLFGGVYIGLAMPVTAQTQDIWHIGDPDDPDSQPGTWGGHCVFVPKYDEFSFTCITWGGLQKMTLPFWEQCCDEAHALLSNDWLGAKGSPAGLDLALLEADLQAVTA